MHAFLLILIGFVYAFLLAEGYTKGAIRAKGYFWHIRIYDRDTEPGKYWFTFALYVVLTFVCFGFGVYFW